MLSEQELQGLRCWGIPFLVGGLYVGALVQHVSKWKPQLPKEIWRSVRPIIVVNCQLEQVIYGVLRLSHFHYKPAKHIRLLQQRQRDIL